MLIDNSSKYMKLIVNTLISFVLSFYVKACKPTPSMNTETEEMHILLYIFIKFTI